MQTPDGKDIIPGCEPWSAAGGPHGVLVLHGFTGNPQSMRGLAEAFAAAGFAVEIPLLPGHGTSVDDLDDTGWADWSGGNHVDGEDLFPPEHYRSEERRVGTQLPRSCGSRWAPYP